MSEKPPSLASEPGADNLTPNPRAGWVFIDWSSHCSRSENFSKRVGMKFLRRHRKHNGLASFALKYAYQLSATTVDLLRERPRVVWCMSPSTFTALPVWLYCKATGAKFGIDAHTGAFEGTPWAKIAPLQFFLSRQAAVTAVTNGYLQALVEGARGRTLLVPDVPTELSSEYKRDYGPGFHALYVASYSSDEPIDVVIDAARRAPDVTFWLTGKPKGKAQGLLSQAPPNVKLLGFLARDEYLAAIAGADVVVALTTRDHTMQRAAYEAIYLGTPVVVSDWPILRENFDMGALWVENTGADLAAALRQAAQTHDQLRSGAQELRQKKLDRWRKNYERIVELLEGH
jgi:glycosyltransferase involved in cell wall biosynthesis